jgi:hypothetical protein
MMVVVAKHAPPHENTTNLALILIIIILGFCFGCIGEGVYGGSIRAWREKKLRANIYGSGTTELGTSFYFVGKAIQSLGVLFWFYFLFFPIPTYKLHFLSIVYLARQISDGKPYICISRCHPVAFFVYQTLHLHFLRATLEYEARINATSLFLLIIIIIMKIFRGEMSIRNMI